MLDRWQDQWRQICVSPIALGYLFGWKVAGALPRSLALWLAYAGADWACQHGRGAEQLRRNLTRVVGAENVTRALVRTAMRSYARYWVEAFRLPRLTGSPALVAELDRSVAGQEHLDKSMASGHGVILVLPHSGNWDMAGVWLAHHAGGFTTVAERLEPALLFDAFVNFRTQLGFTVLSHSATTTGTYAQLAAALRRGEIVALLGERDLKQHGSSVTFFGEAATFPAGPARLALETGAALHVVDLFFTDGGWGMRVSPPVDVDNIADTTQRIAIALEDNIAAHPADWHMLQPLWLADIPRRNRK